MSDRVDILRLHTDDSGVVWYGDDSRLAVNSGLQAPDFIASGACDLDGAGQVRLLGTRSNARLIVHLSRKPASRDNPTRLASPSLLATAALRRDPEAVLQHLWQPGYHGVCCGMWHDLSPLDHCAYELLTCLKPDGTMLPGYLAVACRHPAWHALSFLPSLDENAACRLLCEIVDPRWYVHPHRPGRLSKLYTYLGLTPANAKAYFAAGFPGRHYYRASLAIRTWYSRRLVDLRGADRDGPRNFLWRQYVALSGKDNPGAVLRTTRRLVRMVYEVWMAGVQPGHPDAGFLPQRFFEFHGEARAFAEHRGWSKAV